ncbi:unnamed protein product, partial [Brassica oleracea var. botrytis]
LEGALGRRPSFVWHSILHGRDLLKQGLVKKIGNGAGTNVWRDNWLLDSEPRPPSYRPDYPVDLTLSVSDLLNPHLGGWDVRRVRQVIAAEDVERVLNTKTDFSKEDSLRWGFSNNGIYNSKSGYKLLQDLQEQRGPASSRLPPIEKQLWSKLWKVKAPSKLKHFLWRSMSGALAVKQQLRSRGIRLDPVCPLCGLDNENISHMLFHCPREKEVWKLSLLPLPPAGLSRNSVFLNFHHLFSCSSKVALAPSIRLIFPWVLWHIWKARNLFCFEQTKLTASEIYSRAMEDALEWLQLHNQMDGKRDCISPVHQGPHVWKKPPHGVVKCNVGSSWSNISKRGGAAWIVRNEFGSVLCHGRCSFPNISSPLNADLQALSWATEAMDHLKMRKVLFDFSLNASRAALTSPWAFPDHRLLIDQLWDRRHRFEVCQFNLVPVECNYSATEIAVSVTRDGRLQSYIASNGPSWL